MKEQKDTRFKPGESGNPAGPKPGSGWVARARKALEDDWHGTESEPGIKSVLISKARGGDMAAIRIIAERVCPPIKAAELTAPFEMPEGTLTEQGKGIMQALSRGELSPGQASQLMQALGAMARVLEVDDHARRLEALEAKDGKH